MAHISTSAPCAWRAAFGLAAVSLAGFGFLYSMAGVGLGQLLYPERADGSMIVHQGKVLGSELVAQPFAAAGYFQSRPSAAGYDPMGVSGSNAARTNQDLRKRVDEARAAVAAREGVDPAQVPSDLVTQSGGGIDPHISPEAAAIQVGRVAAARGLAPEQVQGLVARYTEAPQFGLLGQPRVKVLPLNLALDRVSAGAR
ncbi:potassium-transporting ATPase subunit KdpC [Massilia sp. UMI-21]|nr:potassium-transporting ATPase subunit KdpC [Massilia sp. UMI-21]